MGHPTFALFFFFFFFFVNDCRSFFYVITATAPITAITVLQRKIGDIALLAVQKKHYLLCGYVEWDAINGDESVVMLGFF